MDVVRQTQEMKEKTRALLTKTGAVAVTVTVTDTDGDEDEVEVEVEVEDGGYYLPLEYKDENVDDAFAFIPRMVNPSAPIAACATTVGRVLAAARRGDSAFLQRMNFRAPTLAQAHPVLLESMLAIYDALVDGGLTPLLCGLRRDEVCSTTILHIDEET